MAILVKICLVNEFHLSHIKMNQFGKNQPFYQCNCFQCWFWLLLWTWRFGMDRSGQEEFNNLSHRTSVHSWTKSGHTMAAVYEPTNGHCDRWMLRTPNSEGYLQLDLKTDSTYTAYGRSCTLTLLFEMTNRKIITKAAMYCIHAVVWNKFYVM